ncbi:ABC transporter substrate-binding protein [Desmospora activa]|uniref:Carbohydrate ABC transporter substrate-binding protein (CUT1 family) n=1 Tax=Desmospora activa DSM 45169 TaxID=1121389 RepID=A0A2T4Z452_9BACL|nr:sugar ABC transporter substrate-binding protein [Desmospora activa]PTM56654.1 carbohydrate ABC transporter substrate-binding protein (CUT1 family) [Desmospora activa DSM 45169]
MINWGKKSLFLFGLVLCMVLVQACSGSADGKEQLTMSAWGNPAELKVYQRAIDAYMEKNPDVSIKLVPIPVDGYEQKLITQLTGGGGSDLFYVGAEYTSRLVEGNTIEPLTDFLNSEESYTKPDDYAEGLWGAAKKEDEIYGVPVDSNPLVMYYNIDLFKELGIKTPQQYYDEGEWNWDAFKKVTTELKKGGKKGYVQEKTLHMIESWIWSNGGSIYDEDGNLVLDNDKKAQEAIAFIDSLIQDGNAVYAGALPEGQGLDAMFLSQQVGMISAGHWLTPMFEEAGVNYDYIPWPTNTGNEREPVVIPTAYLSVNANTDKKEEAMKFLSFYVSKEGQTARLSGVGNAIPSVSGIDEIVEDQPKHVHYVTEARETGYAHGSPKSKSALTPGLVNDMEDLFDVMLLGKATPEETVEKVVKTIEEKTDQ